MAFFLSGIHASGFWVLVVVMARVSRGCAGVHVPSLRSGNSKEGWDSPSLTFFFFQKRGKVSGPGKRASLSLSPCPPAGLG